MKWKRSRKAQQEAKNKDNRGSSTASEDKHHSNERSSSSNSNNQTAAVFKNGLNEKVITSLNSTGNGNFQPSTQSHLPLIPRHLATSSKDIQNDDNYPRHQSTVFESDEMIWRVV